MILSLISSLALSAQNTSPKPKQVLAIFVFKQGMPWAYHLEKSLRTTLAKKVAPSIELNVEYADQSRFPEAEYLAKIIDLYQYKYSKQKVDLVLIMGDESMDLMLNYGEMLFGDVPQVLITTAQQPLLNSRLKPNMISIKWGFDFDKTVSLIEKILPQTQHLFVISGTSISDKKLKLLATKALANLDKRFNIHYLDNYSAEQLFTKVAQLPENSAIFFLSLFRDGENKAFIPREIMTTVSKKANAPTFGIVDLYLGHGIVGGNLLSASRQGQRYADISEKILTGVALTHLDFKEKGNQMMFDWRQLQRWSIDESLLPADSIIRHHQPSLWQQHQQVIIGVFIIIFTQAMALIIILTQHKRRRLAEQETQRLKDERTHISRVLAMGEIAASLAHEINQPLSAIRSYAQAAQRFLNNKPAEIDEVDKALSGIIIGNRRAEAVIQRIRMALKKEPFQQLPLNVKTMIEEVIPLVQSKANQQNIVLTLKISAHLPAILGDNIQLQQVLFNLIMNAMEAINNEGEILISATKQKSHFVCLSVQDNGSGIEQQQVSRLFEAFYSTKTEGMGIGLSISRSIIEDHGGQLWMTQNVDKGSCFAFTIPINN